MLRPQQLPERQVQRELQELQELRVQPEPQQPERELREPQQLREQPEQQRRNRRQ